GSRCPGYRSGSGGRGLHRDAWHGKRLDVSILQFGRWITVAPAGSATTIALFLAREGVPAGVETGIRLTAALGVCAPDVRILRPGRQWARDHAGRKSIMTGIPLDKHFTAALRKSPNKGGWTYVVMPDSAEYF